MTIDTQAIYNKAAANCKPMSRCCSATHPHWVGLACIRQAPVGGGSRLASAVAVDDHLAMHAQRRCGVIIETITATWTCAIP